MKSLALLLSLIVVICLISPANAQATRTWVSGVGNDANPCSFTAPCKTFAGAIPKTAVNGEIDCLDPGGFGAITILKSLTIDCTGTFGSILASGTNAIIINFDGFAATDTVKTVRLRGLSINGAVTGLNGIRILGAAAALGSEVFIEDLVIDGFSAGARGITDERTGGGELSVLNSSIRNMAGIGIAVLTGTVRKDVLLDNVSSLNSSTGFFAGNNVKAMIVDSTFALNGSVGVQAETGSEVNIDQGVISNNATGLTANGTVRLANTNLTLNNTGISGSGAQSYGNNRLIGNVTAGTAPLLIGNQSHDSGQQ
jgi:hypothetical protein